MKRVMYGPWWGTDDWDEDEDWWDDWDEDEDWWDDLDEDED